MLTIILTKRCTTCHQAFPDTGQTVCDACQQKNWEAIADNLMIGFTTEVEEIRRTHKIKAMHRGELDKHKAEIYAYVARAAGKFSFGQIVHDILERENYHYLNQALKDLGCFREGVRA